MVTVVLSDASPAFSVVLCVSVVFSAPAISARPSAKIRRKHHGDTEDHGECLVRARPHYPTSLPSVPSLGPKGVLDLTGPHRSSARGSTNRRTCWGPDYPGQQANCGTEVASFIYPFWPLAVGFLAAQMSGGCGLAGRGKKSSRETCLPLPSSQLREVLGASKQRSQVPCSTDENL